MLLNILLLVQLLTYQSDEITSTHEGQLAFSLPLNNLNSKQEKMFFIGNSFFKKNWVMAPASTTSRDGLGPHFDARSCSGCHFMDGRGNPMNNPASLVFSLYEIEGNTKQENLMYGQQLTRFAIQDFVAEGTVKITEKESSWLSESAELVEFKYDISWRLGKPDESTIIGPRIAPHLVGLGLIEAINNKDIMTKHDPNDNNNDGISGRVNWIDSDEGYPQIGLFGWQAESPDVNFQVAKALVNDMGITNPIFTQEICSKNDVSESCKTNGDIDINNKIFTQLVFYSKALAVPKIRMKEAAFNAGLKTFRKVKCDSCHTPFYTTNAIYPETTFATKKIAPFSDFLLHDMGDQLADKDLTGQVQQTEWKTPPLWGIGLIDEVNKHTRFLHDGRARSIHEAILWHGGEAEISRQLYQNLNVPEMTQLIEFINAI